MTPEQWARVFQAGHDAVANNTSPGDAHRWLRDALSRMAYECSEIANDENIEWAGETL